MALVRHLTALKSLRIICCDGVRTALLPAVARLTGLEALWLSGIDADKSQYSASTALALKDFFLHQLTGLTRLTELVIEVRQGCMPALRQVVAPLCRLPKVRLQ